jgi:hypothetical protein
MRRDDKRPRIQFQQMLSPVKIGSDDHELLVVGYAAGSTAFIACQVRKNLSRNPNHLSTAGGFFLTTWEALHEEITDGRSRPKRTSLDEPALTASSLIRAGSRFSTSHQIPFSRWDEKVGLHGMQ